jgi:biotin transport system substrate-specific component
MVKKLTLAAVMTAVMAVCSQIAVPVPFAGVVLSLGTFAVFCTGLLLSPRYALLSLTAYVLLGAAGAPVFAGFAGGVGVILGPTGGFIFAYPVMAFVTASFVRKKHTYIRAALGTLTAIIVCYTLGTVWYSFWAKIDFSAAFVLVGLPFIPFDTFKAACAIVFCKQVRKILKRYDM